MQNLQTVIQPENIATNRHFFGAFDHNETEVSARLLVKLAQKNGTWRNFSKTEVDAFAKHDFRFNELIDGKYIVDNGDKTYSFTDAFIAQCYRWSPAPRPVSK